jgi:alpha-beta hydrolase superfamily lysophospholipase
MGSEVARPKRTPVELSAQNPRLTPAFLPRGPVPCWFGPEDLPVFGWFHPGAAPARPTGVVLCSPLGIEMMSTHRAYRQLANRLAEAGFPVLRFDYHGTGDSGGGDDDPERVSAWLASVAEAIEALKARAGVGEVSLFGLRLGGTLAATAAAGRSDVRSLVLWSPIRSGKSYVRELRALRRLAPGGEAAGPSPSRWEAGDEEVLGFVLRSSTIEGLSTLDLAALEHAPAPRVLVLAREDGSADKRVVDSLRALGSDVSVEAVPGYDALMAEDPYKSVLPEAALTSTVAWLSAAHPRHEGRSAPPLATSPATQPVVVAGGEDEPLVAEQPVEFGDGTLFGMLGTPVSAPAGPARPAVLLVSIGANHHVGTHRIYVPMARAWAAGGFSVLRFDLSGIGDSQPHPGQAENRLYALDLVADVRQAMDFVARATGARSFVLVGLCSGAFTAFHAALADERVRGVMLLNPLRFHWGGQDSIEKVEAERRQRLKSTRFYKQALLKPDTWKRALSGQIKVGHIVKGALRRGAERARSKLVDMVDGMTGNPPGGHDLRRAFRKLAERGTNVLLVFNGDEPALEDLEGTMGRDLPGLQARGQLRLEIMDGTDHVFTPVWSQERLRGLLTEHLERTFSGKTR